MPDAVRSTLLAVGLAGLAGGVYYRIQSQRSGEPLDRRREGWPLLIGIRLTGLLSTALMFAFLYRPAWFEAATLSLPERVRWVGVGGFACSVAWMLWMLRALGRNLTDTVVTRRDATFVDHGPYRFVRNPMYTGILMLGLSVGLALGTWLAPFCASLIFTLLALRTRIEERYLVERFGDRYRRYMERVGRFFPKLGRH